MAEAERVLEAQESVGRVEGEQKSKVAERGQDAKGNKQGIKTTQSILDSLERPDNLEITKPAAQAISRNDKGQFAKGQSGNPSGRVGAKSIKTRIREYLEEHPESMEAFVNHFVKDNRELAWQMLEGRPAQDITSDGEKLPQPLLANLNVSINKRDKQDSQPEEEN